MSRKNKIKILKILITILVVILLSSITVYLFPVMKDLSSIEGQARFKEKVETSGIAGMILLFGLQFAQVFLFIVPGEPVEILAGMCYGPIWGTIFIMISVFIITIMIYFLVKKFGKGFVYDFCDKRKIRKIENNKLFQNPKKIEMIMFILFFLPGTPKDFLIYVGALLPIKSSKFILISTLARFPSIISSTLAGSNIAVGNWKVGILLYIGVVILAGIIILIENKFDKEKITDKVLETIK